MVTGSPLGELMVAYYRFSCAVAAYRQLGLSLRPARAKLIFDKFIAAQVTSLPSALSSSSSPVAVSPPTPLTPTPSTPAFLPFALPSVSETKAESGPSPISINTESPLTLAAPSGDTSPSPSTSAAAAIRAARHRSVSSFAGLSSLASNVPYAGLHLPAPILNELVDRITSIEHAVPVKGNKSPPLLIHSCQH
jgi:hypothetical protein